MDDRAASPPLEQRIAETLFGDPVLDGSRIRIAVGKTGGVVLDGSVHTYAEKCLAEELVRRVEGVARVRNQLDVRLTIGDYRTDATLERVFHDLFEFLARMPPERPRVRVLDGWVTLEGAVPFAFQKELLERVVRDVAGVRGITNRLRVVDERRTSRPPLGAATS